MAQQIGQYMTIQTISMGYLVHIITSLQTMDEELRFNFWQDKEIFPSSEASILDLGLMSFLLNIMGGNPSLGINGWIMKLNTHH
jgi:hypothetical protein